MSELTTPVLSNLFCATELLARNWTYSLIESVILQTCSSIVSDLIQLVLIKSVRLYAADLSVAFG